MFASWVAWTTWLIHDVPVDHRYDLVLGYLDGPRLEHPWTWFLSFMNRRGVLWTYSTRGAACLGVFIIAGVPCPFRTPGRRWAGYLLRITAVLEMIATFGPLLLSVTANLGGRGEGFVTNHQAGIEAALKAGDDVLRNTDAAVWAALGVFVAVTTAAAGRPAAGYRAASLLLVVAVTTTLLDRFEDPDRHHQTFFALRIAHTVLTMEAYLLALRFGWLALWAEMITESKRAGSKGVVPAEGVSG